jgi:elongation factor G
MRPFGLLPGPWLGASLVGPGDATNRAHQPDSFIGLCGPPTTPTPGYLGFTLSQCRSIQLRVYALDCGSIVPNLRPTNMGSSPQSRLPPSLELALETGSPTGAKALIARLLQLGAERSDMALRIDEPSLQIILGGTDEQRLGEIVAQLRNDLSIAFSITPAIAYREIITRPVEHDFVLDEEGEDGHLFARITFRIEPDEAVDGVVFENVAKSLPALLAEGVEKGVQSVAEFGPLEGYPMTQARFTLTDGAYQQSASTADAFEVAARRGFERAISFAGPGLVEPIISASVRTPELFLGQVVADLYSRRGRVLAAQSVGDRMQVDAKVPMGNMLGYASALRALTGGSGTFSIQFDHYEILPDRPDGPDGPFAATVAMRA